MSPATPIHTPFCFVLFFVSDGRSSSSHRVRLLDNLSAIQIEPLVAVCEPHATSEHVRLVRSNRSHACDVTRPSFCSLLIFFSFSSYHGTPGTHSNYILHTVFQSWGCRLPNLKSVFLPFFCSFASFVYLNGSQSVSYDEVSVRNVVRP